MSSLDAQLEGSHPLKLLSLGLYYLATWPVIHYADALLIDGGGVRGLSILIILKIEIRRSHAITSI